MLHITHRPGIHTHAKQDLCTGFNGEGSEQRTANWGYCLARRQLGKQCPEVKLVVPHQYLVHDGLEPGTLWFSIEGIVALFESILNPES